MVKSYKARGIVLHTLKYGDSSQVACLLTDVHGRQSYMVYKRSGLLQPMFLVELEGLENPKAEMHRFREIRAAVPLLSVPFDVRKSTLALFMAEILYRLVREVEPNSPLFEFVWRAVGDLDAASDPSAVANFHLSFMVGLSRHLGFFPGNEWSPGHWFDIREGLFTPIQPHGDHFSRENAALLANLMDVATSPDQSDPPPFRLNRSQRTDFLNAMLSYFGYHLDAVRDIRSVDILREVF